MKGGVFLKALHRHKACVIADFEEQRGADVTKDGFSETFLYPRTGYAKGVSRGRIEEYPFYPETRAFKRAPFECFLLSSPKHHTGYRQRLPLSQALFP